MNTMPSQVLCTFRAINDKGVIVAEETITSDDFSDDMEKFLIKHCVDKEFVRLTADLALALGWQA